MNSAMRNGLIKFAKFSDLLSDLGRVNHGVRRTISVLENAFPTMTWGDPDRKTGPVYLTFDDGPDPENTVPILEVLEKHGIQGCFFLLGDRIPAAPEVVDRILSGGHRIGYHGMTHKTWWFQSPTRLGIETDPMLLSKMMDNPFEDVRTQPLLLRPPFGRFDLTLLERARQLGAHVVMYRLVIGDWIEDQDADRISGKLLLNTRPGDIVVLHDGGSNGHLLADALERVIPLWKMKGYTFGDINQLEGVAA
ncbi:polysaccharide deacetylase family protein [bacterium]|nr:polysaccharide deacetylase family protein [bacterium]